MSKKTTSRFVCSSCGAESAAWSGRCFACGEWNTLQQTLNIESSAISHGGQLLESVPIKSGAQTDRARRFKTGIDEVDEVLGGGLVAGSVTLIAGQPGIGKSTLLLQLADTISRGGHNLLYVSGEESIHQVGLRAERLGVAGKNLHLAMSNSADDIAATIVKSGYDCVVVDSIQTVSASAISSAPGSVAQITNSTQLLISAAKQTNTALIVVGHVTKEGSIAGPKVLEHVVDVVLQLEGDRYGGFKLLRAAKNRFGSTQETGIFEMSETGLKPVSNPSAALLEERQVSDGSVVLATMEGTRPLLVEIQALVNPTTYGYAKRAASGVDLNRINLLVAMLEKRTKLRLAEHDIYVNVVGGMKLSDPGADLALCMAIASATKGLQLKRNAVVFGEVGLSGEVRHVPFTEKRLAEATKLGFEGAIGPMIRGSTKKPKALFEVPDVRTALNQFLEKD